LAMKNLHPRLKPFVVFVATWLLIVGCEPTSSVLNKNFMSFSKFPSEDAVVFKNIYEYKEGIAGMLKLVDSTLIIFNVQPGANNFLNNYSLNSGVLSDGYFGKGRGPGEVIGPRAIGIRNNTVWLQDITLRKVFTIDKRKVTNASFNEYPFENHYYMIDFKDSLHFFGVGNINSKYKIQEIDLISGRVINEYGKIEQTSGDIPLQLFKSVYQSFIFARPNGDKIVLPYRYIDAIEIFDTKTGSSIAIHGPEEYDVKYEALPNGMSRTDKTRFAFVNGTVTNEYIYLAYSGRTRKSSNSYDGNYVYVYDWDGNPIRKLTLDRYIQGLAVTKDNKILYSFDVNTGYLIQAKIN
jgi:hypothetical protein